MELTASRVPADAAGSGWYEILPPPPPPVALERDIDADWVIVGAGFAGLSAARRLSLRHPDARVAVLEAQRVGWGAAGRNSGFFIDLPHNLQNEDYVGEDSDDRRQIELNRFAIDFAREVIAERGLERYASTAGRINAATDAAGLAALTAYSRHLRALGEPFTELDRSGLAAVTGIDYYAGGIHTPGCLMVQPAGYIRGLADSLGNNVRVYEHTPALRIQPGAPCRVVTPGGAVTAHKAILTVNGHLESFGLLRGRLMHVFLYGSMSRELTDAECRALGGDAEWGVTPAHPMGSSVRRLRENRILVRNHITYNPARATSNRLIATARKRHERSFRARFPMLGGVELEHCWAGHLCLSRNSAPVFGEVEKNLFAAGCQNGLGATQGTFSGLLIADHAAGHDHDMVRGMLQRGRPCKLPPEPFMSLGAKAHLWWGQRRAGRDL